MLLGSHGETVTGQMCDLELGMKDVWRKSNFAIFGEHPYWNYKRSFEQLDKVEPPNKNKIGLRLDG
jgi:hypothetical protein